MTDLTEERDAFEKWHYGSYGVPFDRYKVQHAGRRSGWLNGLSWERNLKAGEQPDALGEVEQTEPTEEQVFQVISDGLSAWNEWTILELFKLFRPYLRTASPHAPEHPAKQDFGSAEACECPLPYRSIIPEQHIDSCPVMATKQNADACLSSVSDKTVCVSETVGNDGQIGRGDVSVGEEGLAGEPISDYALNQLKLHIMETLLDDEPKKGAKRLTQLVIRLNNAENQLRTSTKPSPLTEDERRHLLDSMREFIPSLSYHGKDLTGTHRADACCTQVLSAIEQKYHFVPKE